jgi:hypothetical protein
VEAPSRRARWSGHCFERAPGGRSQTCLTRLQYAGCMAPPVAS